MPTRQRIKSELIDLKDDVKFELSELNNQKRIGYQWTGVSTSQACNSYELLTRAKVCD